MRRAGLAALLMLAAGSTQAQGQVVIYRCTDATGALTVQNDEPCPKGEKQERSVIDPPPPLPAYVPLPSPPATASAPRPVAPLTASDPKPAVARPITPPAADILDEVRLPPPPIYQCNTWDNDSYLSENPEPKPRCVRLQTTGLGGNPDKGAGAACEMKYDQCQRVADGTACDGWRKRQQEIESGWRFAKGADKPALQDEFTRVTRILSDTTCGP
ncbi:MAG: DUF4124 domain-containing protein [Luteimonas sp.]